MLKLPILKICERCGNRRVFGQPCDCEAPSDIPPMRGQLPTTEHIKHFSGLITEEDVKRANRGYGK